MVKEYAIISTTGVHALKALAFLGQTSGYADAKAIARVIDAPPNYLGKLLGQLARAGVVEAKKGLGGGFRLTKPADELSLYEALSPIEELIREGDCFLGARTCDGSKPCALHGHWSSIRFEMMDLLKTTTLATFARRDRTED